MKRLVSLFSIVFLLMSCSEDDKVGNSSKKALANLSLEEVNFSDVETIDISLSSSEHSSSFGAVIENGNLTIRVNSENFDLSIVWDTERKKFEANKDVTPLELFNKPIYGTFDLNDEEYGLFNTITLSVNTTPELNEFIEVDLKELNVQKSQGGSNIKNVTGKIKVKVVEDDGSLSQ